MTIESLLASTAGLLVLGFLIGLIVAGSVSRHALGCILLLAVPVAMWSYVDWWHGQNPDKLRSTSSLDFLFGPLWPSLGAIAGFYAGKLLRSLTR